MSGRRHDRATMDLFVWEPPALGQSFQAQLVRGASLRARICKAIALALKECGRDREAIAAEIAAYLGETIPKNMLDAYASAAREDHTINVVRFLGLVHATGDLRLLQVLAAEMGAAVIPAKYLPAIEEAILADKIEELERRKHLARKSWRGA